MSTVAPVFFKAVLAFVTKLLVDAELVSNHVFGPIRGRGAIDLINLEQNAKFAYNSEEETFKIKGVDK